MTLNYNNAYSAWQQEQIDRKATRQLAATEAMLELKQRGVSTIEMYYSGVGDEGYVEEYFAYNSGEDKLEKISTEEKEALESYLYELVPNGWEIGDGSKGSVMFNIETGEVDVAHEEAEIVYTNIKIPSVNLYENLEAQ